MWGGSFSETCLFFHIKVCLSFQPLNFIAYHGLTRSYCDKNDQDSVFQKLPQNTRLNEYILSQIRASNVALSLNRK